MATIFIDRDRTDAVCIYANTCTDACVDCQLSIVYTCDKCHKHITGWFNDNGQKVCDDCAPVEWLSDDFVEEKETTFVECNCDDGYTGPDGHTCERCEGSGMMEVYVADVSKYVKEEPVVVEENPKCNIHSLIMELGTALGDRRMNVKNNKEFNGAIDNTVEAIAKLKAYF